jgi:hypothetical protein
MEADAKGSSAAASPEKSSTFRTLTS